MKAAIGLRERLEVLRVLIEKASHLQDIIEFLSDDLNGPSAIQTNEAMAFIWFNLIESQVITLNKIFSLSKNDSMSLYKIINCGEATQKGFRDCKFGERLDSVLQDFKKFRLDDIRDKFVAHIEITNLELSTNAHRLSIVKNGAVRLFNDIAEFISEPQYCHEHTKVDSLQKALCQI